MTFKKNEQEIKIPKNIIEKIEEMGDLMLVYISTAFKKDILVFDKKELV
ncbi:hypothetical protein [Cetobacterium sp.]